MAGGGLPSRFPTEIHEEIIYWVHLLYDLSRRLSIEERQIRLLALCSCALTCRAWLPASRAYLYSNFTFFANDTASLDLLVRSLDANPWLQTLITRVNVYDQVTNCNTTPASHTCPKPTPKPPGTISNTWAILLAGKLPRLHTLNLAFADHGLARHPRLVRSLQTFSTVTALSLTWRSYSSGPGTFADLLKNLAMFPNLQSASLTGLVCRRLGAASPVVRPRRFPALSKLLLLNGVLIERCMEREVTRMLLQTVAGSVRILGVGLSCIPHTSSDEQMALAQTLPRLQVLHYFGSPTSLSEHVQDLQYKHVADWAFRSAPLLEHLVFHFPALARRAYTKCRFLRRFVQTLVGIHLAENILPYLSNTTTTMITLLLCDDVPREMQRQAVLATTAIVCVRRIVSRLARCPDMNVVWNGLTELSNGLPRCNG
ncbi:hypothetical protein GY45DRAFT_332891 [Cubamyces sp. BRFM 1775]|nr:hypothetical protein GY45DRAFT_332891 [Cubamyces sp. BRFM 1775]